MSMIALIFLEESNKVEASLWTKVVHSSGVSKRKRAPTFIVTIVGAPRRGIVSSSILIEVSLVPLTTLHTFLGSIKSGDSNL